ncbi:rRNA maturation RNase YbeY [Pueribacillus theae]|uniref:Endoribonuclease YbeY n=2 Tax=Pueribacillus theae TaxID=2171751 RepID=A0A2U1K4L7_9BACI|nr:rRNA maturation RNase YbeY [Pueribacillus theae]
MGLFVHCLDETEMVQPEECELVEKLLLTAAKLEQVTGAAEVSVTFVDNDRIQAINKEYRGIDQPTDVLSFALEEMEEDEIEVAGGNLPRLLGDIIISIPKARQQAEEYHHSFHRELGFLAVHGFLHLLGYDHMTEEDEKEMFTKQEGILDEFGLTR